MRLRFILRHAAMINPAAAPAIAVPPAAANESSVGRTITDAARKYAEASGLPPASNTAKCRPYPNGLTVSTSAHAPASMNANVSACTTASFIIRRLFIRYIITCCRRCFLSLYVAFYVFLYCECTAGASSISTPQETLTDTLISNPAEARSGGIAL